ncbi:AAA family ATPase, partial [uncultured Roseibium sp.]|uniref:ParA family protein n=1 Tax=uncultured Roseibium sp. TaxID=1936171 RepID=UPI0026295A45
MKILQITNRKGGVGKTTIACHAAWYFGESKRVLFVELDTQRNASRTLQPHKSRVVASDLLNGSVEIPGLPGPGIKVISADDGLKSVSIDPARHMVQMRRNLEAAGANYEVCILDTAPSADTLNIGPLLFASHVLAPIELNVTVRAGSKTFLVPKAKSSDEAMKLVQDHLGKAVVRVGLTQYPVG